RYVTFLDSDDVVYEHHLATAAKAIEKYVNPEIFHLGFELTDITTGTARSNPLLQGISNERMIDGNQLSCNGVFVRRDIALKHPFNPDRDLSGTEDYELWLRLASRYPIYCESEVTSSIMQHDARSV